jgi:hypothetical protein
VELIHIGIKHLKMTILKIVEKYLDIGLNVCYNMSRAGRPLYSTGLKIIPNPNF